ncbi:hypothetical protein KJ966_23770 [bacterium]|nr:hypothetical protein [bacterium]
MKKTGFLILFGIIMILFACERNGGEEVKESPDNHRDTEYTFKRGGSPVEVVVKLSSVELELTDFLTVTIESRFPEDTHITPPYLSEEVYAPLLLIENPKNETVWAEKKNLMINRWTYRFEPLISGEFELNPFIISFRLEKEKTDNLNNWPVYKIYTEPIKYSVSAINYNELDDIRDIKGMILPPFKYLPLIISLVIIGFIISSIFLFQKYGKNVDALDPTVPEVDFHQQALLRLKDLEQRDLIGQSAFDQYHTELANILRDYIENIFGLRAKEQTTEEFIKEVYETQHFNTEQRQILDRYLRLADLVKFATFNPGSEISISALNNVRTFVQTTGRSDEV